MGFRGMGWGYGSGFRGGVPWPAGCVFFGNRLILSHSVSSLGEPRL